MLEDKLKEKIKRETDEKERQMTESERKKKHRSDFDNLADPIIKEYLNEFLKLTKKYNIKKTKIEVSTSGMSQLFGRGYKAKEAWSLPIGYIGENGTFYFYDRTAGGLNTEAIFKKVSLDEALEKLCDHFYERYIYGKKGNAYQIVLDEAEIRKVIEIEFLNCMHTS